ncbi:MAG: mechanosensitive ion channel family protein [Brevirhabdus sp.]
MAEETVLEQTAQAAAGSQVAAEQATDLATSSSELLSQIQNFAESMLQPWRLYQMGIVLALVILAYLLAKLFRPRGRDWLAQRTDMANWRLKAGLLLLRRLPLIFFVVLSWATVFAMRELTWPSRSYLVMLFATIATAWLLVGFVTRLIRNRFLRRTASWAAWIFVTLYYLGFADEAGKVMDGIAIEFGDFRLSLLAVVKAIVVTTALILTARFIVSMLSIQVRRNDDISPSMRVLTIKVVQLLLYSAAVFVGLKAVGFDLTGLAVLSGAIGVGLGFGLQKVVSNLVSGVIILLDKSIKPGDVISLGETFGWINTLGARYTSVVTRDGKEFLIPNEDLITGQVVNWSHSDDYVRLDVFFGTSYHDDPHKVRELAIEAAASVDRVLGARRPVCHIVGFGDHSVDYILRFWIEDPTGGLTNIRGNVYLALWDAFHDNGVSIPFPQREVRLVGGGVGNGPHPSPPSSGD